jgi:hypothetical protein
LGVHVLWSNCHHLRPDLDFKQKVEIVAVEIEGLVDLDPRSIVSTNVLSPVLVQSVVDSAEEIIRLLSNVVLLVFGEMCPVFARGDRFPASKEPVPGDEHVGLLRMPTVEGRRGGLVVGSEEVIYCRLARS